MKNEIIKLIASSKNSYELADRICELFEKREKEIYDKLEPVLNDFVGSGKVLMEMGYTGAGTEMIENVGYMKSIFYHPTPTSPEDSRRDVGKEVNK